MYHLRYGPKPLDERMVEALEELVQLSKRQNELLDVVIGVGKEDGDATGLQGIIDGLVGIKFELEKRRFLDYENGGIVKKSPQ